MVSPRAPEVKATYTSMSDIYHAQGASRVAVILALLTNLAWVSILLVKQGRVAELLGLIPVMLLGVGVVAVLTSVRRNLWKDMQATVANGIIAAWPAASVTPDSVTPDIVVTPEKTEVALRETRKPD
jgi:hypothetical protein